MNVQADAEGIEELSRKLQNAASGRPPKEALSEVGAVVLEELSNSTPVKTGNLKRGWTGGMDAEPRMYARTLPVTHVGGEYSMVLENNVEYATSVEFGHHQHVGRYVAEIDARLVRPWIPGQFCFTNAIDRVSAAAGRAGLGAFQAQLYKEMR